MDLKIKPYLVLLLCLVLFGSYKVEAADCAGALLGSLANGQVAAIVMNSGKGLNDFGNMDGCEVNDGLKYGAMKMTTGIGNLFLGMCLPTDCQNQDLNVVAAGLVEASGGFVSDASFSFTKEEKVDMNGWRVTGITFFSLLACVCIVGMVVEYTSLFDRYKSHVTEPSKDVAQDKNLIGKIFIAFSPSRNLIKLFYSPFNDKDNLKVLNGVRVLSMLYVVFGHAYFNCIVLPTSNPQLIIDRVHPLWFQIVPGGFYAVDVFFYLSSFLGCYLMVSKLEKSRRVPFAMIYFHRFYRLAPTVFLVIMFFMTFYRMLGNGPVWNYTVDLWIGECPKYWWSYVLFINSFIINGRQPGCMGWLWYLSHDMIFFILLPIQVFLYLKNRKIGYITAYLLLVISAAIVLGVTIDNDIGMSIFTSPPYGPKLYFVPWSRLGAYQVGVIIGFMYYEYAKGNTPEGDKRTIGFKFFKSVEISTCVRYACYVIGLAMLIFIVYIQTPETRRIGGESYYPKWLADIWNPIHRPLYVFGLALILAGPLTGKGSFLQVFLGSRFWAPWAKIAFYCYLIHLLVFNLFYGQERQAFYIDNKTVFLVYFGVMVVTFMIAIGMSLFLEAPLLQLERLVLFPPRKKDNARDSEREAMKKQQKFARTSLNDEEEEENANDNTELSIDYKEDNINSSRK